MATPDRIAAVIYDAVNDGTKRLRYFAATTSSISSRPAEAER